MERIEYKHVHYMWMECNFSRFEEKNKQFTFVRETPKEVEIKKQQTTESKNQAAYHGCYDYTFSYHAHKRRYKLYFCYFSC